MNNLFEDKLNALQIPKPEFVKEKPAGQEYVIKAGDTLTRIVQKELKDKLDAMKVADAVKFLAKWNNIKDANKIEAGRKIFLPVFDNVFSIEKAEEWISQSKTIVGRTKDELQDMQSVLNKEKEIKVEEAFQDALKKIKEKVGEQKAVKEMLSFQSIRDMLNFIGVPSDFASREQIFNSNYDAIKSVWDKELDTPYSKAKSGMQNEAMLKWLKSLAEKNIGDIEQLAKNTLPNLMSTPSATPTITPTPTPTPTITPSASPTVTPTPISSSPSIQTNVP